jgi:radical SAM superfamily enzyme YgiQ (UPF0313 family)
VKVLLVYPRFSRHAQSNPELLEFVPMKEYLGSPSLAIAALVGATPPGIEWEYRDDRLEDASAPTDADLVAITFFTAAARRGLELADHFRAMGKKVVCGGVFPTMMPEEVERHADAVVVGEGEPVWADILADAAEGALRPRYVAGPADPATLPPPRLAPYFAKENNRFCPDDYPLQVSRGCPLACQACALPATMGNRMRALPMDYILDVAEQIIAGGRRACLTEDTSWLPGTAGSRRLLELLEHLQARERPLKISYIGISMPMILAAPPRWFELARAAGVEMFYLVGGFDPVTTRAFTGTDDRALARAKAAIQKSWDNGIEPYTSFLLGNEDDDEGTVDRMLAFAAESRIQKAEFAVFTPYPGTPAWNRLVSEDRILTRDWSRYNDANVVFRPNRMSPDALHAGYLRLWREFYAARPEQALPSDAERTIQF